jgi:hypothetical protein
MRSSLLGALLALTLSLAACGGKPAASSAAKPATSSAAGHPRLIIRKSDVGRLRSWATSSNPIYKKGLAVLVKRAKREMDRGQIDDTGSYGYDQYPTESYAELFAFMSLIDPSQKARADYGRRARKLLMTAINEAAKGRKAEAPFRDPSFSISDRSRWQGEAFALTVDWAYPYFSAADKQTIRKVFLRWAKEQYTAFPLTELSGPKPTPNAKANDPALIADQRSVRYSLNNYYIAHARNMGLMAMALDASDDPGGKLRSQIKQVTGSWLFIIDRALRNEAAGGLSPEGFEYGPDAMGRLAQLLISLPDGSARIEGNPFWKDSLTAFIESLPPLPTTAPGEESYRGQIWQPAAFGDQQNYWVLDPITLFGPLAMEAAKRGDQQTVDAVRWIAENVPEGGKAEFFDRAGAGTDQFLGPIFYFLVFDPKLGEPADPRAQLPTRYFAPSLNRTLARTCWCPEGRMFTHKLSYNTIDHQTADGNDFGFYRNGEWLTKNRTSYGSVYTDYTNGVTIANETPAHRDVGDPRRDIWKRGEQWILGTDGDPTLAARSFGDGFVALTGDATNLYNSEYEGVHGVTHASRSIVWLEPDHIVVYDRATTKQPGFKRFWLQLPSAASISGRTATAKSAKGQQLIVNSLLPEGAAISTSKNEGDLGQPTVGEPMKHRLLVEASGDPADVRFLHVLQGADGGAAADAVTRLQSATYDGAAVAGTAVLFPKKLGEGGETTVKLPAGVTKVLITDLKPDGSYSATIAGGTLTLKPGGDAKADAGGVLVVTP